MLSHVTIARETSSPFHPRKGMHKTNINDGVKDATKNVHFIHGYDASLPRGHVLRFPPSRHCIVRKQRETRHLFSSHT